MELALHLLHGARSERAMETSQIKCSLTIKLKRRKGDDVQWLISMFGPLPFSELLASRAA